MPPDKMGQTTRTAKIFLSYERRDLGIVEAIFQELQEAGYQPWLDKKNILPGERWQNAIKKAIKEADFFLACLSRNSVDQQGMLQREIKYALGCLQERLDRDLWIIPVRLEDIKLPEELEEYQWVDWFERDGWSRLRQAIKSQGFPGVDKAPVRTEDRWNILQDSRVRIRDLIGPNYILDATYHFLDWNPSFDELVAKPLGLRRGQHALDFIKKLANRNEVEKRSLNVFGPGKDPLVDVELLQLPSEKFGLIEFQKLAAQIADDHGKPLAWSVNLNILSAERLPQLWQELHDRLEREINWGRYAVSYDQLLIPFDEYQRLLERIIGMVGDAKRCVDLGAGTGNGTIKLLETNKDREVWAIEASESMLRYFRTKVNERVGKGIINPDRLTIIKEDILRLEELPRDYFDAAILINVLYAVDDPEVCLNQAYRVLKSGGILALSTPHRETDVDRLLARLQEVLEQMGLFEALSRNFEGAKQVHNKMNERIHRHTKAEIKRYIEAAGFEIDDWQDSVYVDAVVAVRARKR